MPNSSAEEERLAKYVVQNELSLEQKRVLAEILNDQMKLTKLKLEEFFELANSMHLYEFPMGTNVLVQGEKGSFFFISDIMGSFDVSVEGKGVVSNIKSWSAFGEIALMHNCVRTATVRANVQNARAWGLSRDKFQATLKIMTTRNYRENKALIETIPMFEMLQEQQRVMITNSVSQKTFTPNQNVIRLGERGSILYIIKEGSCIVTDEDGKVLREQQRGEFFGERALLYGEPRSANIDAGENGCVLLSVDGLILESVLGDIQSVLFQNIATQSLMNVECFKNFDTKKLDETYKEMEIKSYPGGYTLIDRDTRITDCSVFVVLEGSILVSRAGRVLKVIERGQNFGSRLLQNPAEFTEYRCDGIMKENILAMLSEDRFQKCLRSGEVQQVENERIVENLRNAYIFKYFPQAKLDWLVHQCTVRKWRPGEMIMREGDFADSFHIIKSGEVEIKKGVMHIRIIGKGDYIGERALLTKGSRRSADVICVSEDCVTWEISREAFAATVGNNEEVLEHFKKRIDLQDTVVDFKKLIVDRVVGRGSFGTVMKVFAHENARDTPFACKMVSRSQIISTGQTAAIAREKELWAENDHPFINKLVRAFANDKYLYFLNELCTGGDLSNALNTQIHFNKDQTVFFTASIAKALEYLHDRHVLFRDLKPENVMLDEKGFVKLIDFGCAKKLQDSSSRTYTSIGTPSYMAPEMLIGKGYGLSPDLWALGVCVYYFASGTLPFEDENEDDNGDQLALFKAILSQPVIFPGELKPDGRRKLGKPIDDLPTRNLIAQLLNRLTDVRLGCGGGFTKYRTFFEHDFFQGLDEDALILGSLTSPYQPPKEDVFEAEDAKVTLNIRLKQFEQEEVLKKEKEEGVEPVEEGDDIKGWDWGFEPTGTFPVQTKQ